MRKNLILLAIAVVMVGIFFYCKLLYRNHRDVSIEKAAFTLSVEELHNQFVKNDSIANIKYADKTIEIHGKITAVDLSANSITVDEKLSGVLKDKLTAKIKVASDVKLKGRLLGYDDLLEELKMDQVSILN